MTQIPTQQEIEKQIAIYGVVVIGENGELLDPTKLKVDDVSKKVAIVGNNIAGLTQSLLSAVGAPQKFAQVDANYWDSRIDKERETTPKMEIKLDPLIIHTPIYDTSSTKSGTIVGVKTTNTFDMETLAYIAAALILYFIGAAICGKIDDFFE